ncbi:portal protein [Enterobacter bugandensis]|uniref:portal protein n=1 Tax=Enterobacter bugandensis TaxID=881260 RepID=UPI0020050F16|nr:portal protein [Enterobacter bugandensis]MCK7435906.1 portal protein [Enterobacter bugandensis]
MDDLASKMIQRFGQMKAERMELEPHWRQCYQFTFPHRGVGFAGHTTPQQAQHQQAELLDSTGSESANVLAASIVSGMTPANSQWLELKSDTETDSVERWLAQVAKLIWRNLHASNWDAENFEANIDGVVGGMFALYVDIDRQRGGFQFQQWPLSECYFASTNGQLVDTVYRSYKLTAAQAVALWGDKAGEKIVAASKDKPTAKFEFLHIIQPRKNYAAGGKLARNMRFQSLNISCEGKAVVNESGYNEFPVVAPRWSRIPGSQYGIGAVSLALPDIKELNILKKWQKQACELAIGGMWIAEDDGVLNPQTVKVGPRKIIVANSVDAMKPLMTGSDFNVSFTTEQNLQAQIRKIMMADTLGQANQGTPMTATEVQARLNLLRQQLGPVFGRYQAEYLTPLVERCFFLMLRAGALPPPPPEMEGVNFHVHFDNPLARAQKLTEVNAIEQFEAGLVNLSQAFPEAMDVYNLEAAQRQKAFALGVPVTCVRSEQEVAGIRQQRQEQQAQQQQAETQQQMQLQNNQAANDQQTQAQAAA